MNPSSIHMPAQTTSTQFGTASTDDLNEVEKCFKQKSYSKAFDKLIFFFGSQEPEEEVKRAYGYLCDILPHLDETRIRSLYLKIFPVLHMFPHLSLQQLDLALLLASRYSAQAVSIVKTPLQQALHGMHYYAKALTVAKKHQPDETE